MKVEVFGDGSSYDPDGGRYTATGYEVIFGGWYDAKSIIARMDEHGTELAEEDLSVAESAGQSDLKLCGELLGPLGAGQVGHRHVDL